MKRNFVFFIIGVGVWGLLTIPIMYVSAQQATPTRMGAAQTNIARQTQCAGIADPIGAFANVRSTPVVAPGNIVATLTTPRAVSGATQSWHELCAFGGFVSGSVIQYVTFTPTATQRPTVTPTVPKSTILIDIDGDNLLETIIQCAKPCRIEVIP